MRRRTVLVVEDDPALADILARTLELDGFAVTRAANGVEALEAVRRLSGVARAD